MKSYFFVNLGFIGKFLQILFMSLEEMNERNFNDHYHLFQSPSGASQSYLLAKEVNGT